MNNVRQYGNATVHRIVDLDVYPMPLGVIFPERDLSEVAHAREILAGTHADFDTNHLFLTIQSHLIRFAGKTILLDACVGEHKERPQRPHWHRRTQTRYLDNLAAAGCRPEDVDLVFCTHLHADHVGWNTRLQSGHWVPTFPNARYLMSQREIDHCVTEIARDPQVHHGSFRDSVQPILDRNLHRTVDAGEAIADDAVVVSLEGHTPGQIGLALGGRQSPRLLFCGDAIHSPVQVVAPDWSSAFCHDKTLSAQTRHALLARAAAEDIVVMPVHLRADGMRIREHAGHFRPIFIGDA